MIRDSFLLDEVRCGFMIPAAVKQAWAAELEVLMEIDRVCKKHNIQYFADWGTLLGTVRHGGFIPWDDDLDIVMKREDYQKFINVARYDMEEGFDVHTFRNHEDCWLFMGKVVGKNSFCFDKEHLRRFHNFPYIACVDVFVLDYVYKDPEKEEKRRRLCKYMLGVADLIAQGVLTSEEKEHRLKELEKMYGKKIRRVTEPVEMRRYLYGEVEKIFGEVPKEEADFLTQLFPRGLMGSEFQFPKEYYEKAINLPFENTIMPVPKMYDKMLRKRYREYCRLVKDKAGHDYPYFEGQKKNLQKVLDFKLPEFEFEKEKLFRSEEENECKGLSYKVMAKECAGELWKMKKELTELIEQTEQNQESIERIINLLQESQQLAIDYGNMMEQVLGEGSSFIHLLEQYCEALYQIYTRFVPEDGVSSEVEGCNKLNDIEVTGVCDELDTIGASIAEELEQKIFNRKVVLFLPVLSKNWSSLDNLWQKYAADETVDVYVVPLPYYYKDYDGSSRKVCCDAAEFPKEICAQDYTLLTPEYLEMLHPEIIVIQNPYDSWNSAISVPPMFYAENIRKYADELVYVQSFVLDEYSKINEREYFNMKYYVTMPGVVYADHIMVQSENMRHMYIEKLMEFAGEETKDVWEQRVSVLPKVAADQGEEYILQGSVQDNGQKKKVFYGISYGAYIGDVEAAQGKIERNFQLFEKCKDQIELTIQVFPNSPESDEVKEFISTILGNYSGKMIEYGVECQPKDYDAYYGDGMPLVIQFRDAGKPVMVQDIYVE